MSGEMERFEPRESRGRIAYEHFHRYSICRELVRDLEVLDIACGAGYGSALLAETARSVKGIDLSKAAIDRAQMIYKRPNLSYLEADCFNLPFDDQSFDIVVANEVIEHVEGHNAFIKEAKRVLKPGGTVLISTPNRPVYNRYKTPNKFHVAEMDHSEFEQLLSNHFLHHRLLGCRMSLLSSSFPFPPKGRNDEVSVKLFQSRYSNDGDMTLIPGELVLSEPEYFLAICSDKELLPIDYESSIYHNVDDDLWLAHEKIMAWASKLHEEDEILRQEVRETHIQFENHENQLAEAEQQFRAERDEAILAFKAGSLAELSAYRERDEIFHRLVGRLAGEEIGINSADLIEGLFLANERLAQLDSQLGTITQLKIDLEGARENAAKMESKAKQSADELEAAKSTFHQQLANEGTRATNALEKFDASMGTIRQQQSDLDSANARASQAEGERRQVADELNIAREELDAAAGVLANANHRIVKAENARVELMAMLEEEAARAKNAELTLETLERDALKQQAAHKQAVAAISEQSESEIATERMRSEAFAEGLAEALRAGAGLKRARQTIASERERAARAEIARDDALVAKLIAERERAEIAMVSEAERKASANTATAINFARIHTSVAGSLEAASLKVRKTIAQSQPNTSYAGRIKEIKKRFGRGPASFMPSWIVRQNPSLEETISWRRYCGDPALFSLDPHPMFSTEYYLSQSPSPDGAPFNPLLHYLAIGWKHGLSPHPLFQNDWYLAQNPDVMAAGLNPLEHYLTHGWREGRLANPVFDAKAYLARYPDVARDDIDPLFHYVAHGKYEGREASSKLVDVQALHLLPAHSRGKGMIEFLLTVRDVSLPSPHAIQRLTDTSAKNASWPPERLDDFWLPQMLRDYIIDSHGAEHVDLYSYLFSVMNRYQNGENDFANSEDLSKILERVRLLANQPRRIDGKASPAVSIIIPVYNNFLDTVLCVLSILEIRDLASIEIIIADDCSSDITKKILPTVGGSVRYVRQTENKGFLGNCNVAAGHARADLLILLNNDTIVLPDWLDQLLAPFAADEHIGMVGSKLLNNDGTLQEAGGIFWNDGTAWNFGRNENPRYPQFNYLKDVDYCSGASFAIPIALWRELGGFDPIYEPAYCEDSDLAFRIRSLGRRTVYNPRSEVIHHEGRSHGKDVSSGIKSYQLINQEKLFKRWRSTLEKDHYPNAQDVFRARDRSFDKKHILVIDHYVPQWDQDAGSRTMYQFLVALVDLGYMVTFWPENLYCDPKYTPKLQALGIEVIYGPTFSGKFADFLEDRSGLFDAALLSRPHIATQFVTDLQSRTDAKILYYGHDLHFARLRASQAVLETDEQMIEDMRALEVSVCNGCDVVFYPSSEEVETIKVLIDSRVTTSTIPAYSYDEEAIADSRTNLVTKSASQETQILFVGGFGHHPNVDGLMWFCSEIAPILRSRGQQFMLKVAGSRATAEILGLSGIDIDVLGFVSDDVLTELYAEANLVIAPLRYGAGVKGKVIEAMASGCPVVTTSIGAQGIPNASEYLYVADTEEAFADAVTSALTERRGAAKRAARALDYVSTAYSRHAIGRVLQTALMSEKQPRISAGRNS